MKKKLVLLSFFCLPFAVNAQQTDNDSIGHHFKKRVLENAEITILTSLYTQNGQNAAVTGGIGTESLGDFASNINIAIPFNADDVLTIDGTVSAYTSASSSNLNPFSGSRGGGGDDDDDEGQLTSSSTGTPWAASSGASRSDTWTNVNVGYSHTSDDRNSIYSGNLSFANEYDYASVGSSVGVVRLYNKKNTELSLNASVFFDRWDPEYPTELRNFIRNQGNLAAGFFANAVILDANGNAINKLDPSNAWQPLNNTLIDTESRNTYALSFGIAQILTKTTQISIFSDITYQTGWLANPMQRVYFSDKPNFYVGNAANIPFYTSSENTDVFQLADDIERLPSSRLKIPIGIRLNQYFNEAVVLRTYYRYYFDDWDIRSHTLHLELSVKLKEKLTLYPSYRFYNQSAAAYFAPYDQLLSTNPFYTSDYDLSAFKANQFGVGLKYTDIFTQSHLWKFGLKYLYFDYNFYQRNTGLTAHIVSMGVGFVMDKPIKIKLFKTTAATVSNPASVF